MDLRRRKKSPRLYLDTSPTGVEEEEAFFSSTPVNGPEDINAQILAERRQDMDQRLIFAGRSFVVTIIWVVFLVAMTFFQMVLSIWDKGLTNPQFVTVVTTTTASVFGYWALVGNYLHRKYDVPYSKARPGESSSNRDSRITGAGEQ